MQAIFVTGFSLKIIWQSVDLNGMEITHHTSALMQGYFHF